MLSSIWLVTRSKKTLYHCTGDDSSAARLLSIVPNPSNMVSFDDVSVFLNMALFIDSFPICKDSELSVNQ